MFNVSDTWNFQLSKLIIVSTIVLFILKPRQIINIWNEYATVNLSFMHIQFLMFFVSVI